MHVAHAAQHHYRIPPLERIDLGCVLDLIRDKRYFVLHGPQSIGIGRSSARLQLALPERGDRWYGHRMGRSDRITVLLSVAALCVTIIGTSCSTNARIDDVHARIDDVNANVNARIDGLSEDIRELRAIVIDAVKADASSAD